MDEGALSLLDEMAPDRFNVIAAVSEATGMEMAVRVRRHDGWTFVWEGATTMKVIAGDGVPAPDKPFVHTDEKPTLMRFLAACTSYPPGRAK